MSGNVSKRTKDKKMTNEDIIGKWVDTVLAGTLDGFYQTQSKNILFSNETIFSYGHHFAMAKVVNGIVYVNENKYSVTTSKHQTFLRRELDKAGIEYSIVPFRGNVEPVRTATDEILEIWAS